MIDQRLLFAVEQDGHGIPLVHVVDQAGAEVGVAAGQHPVADPVAELNVELGASCLQFDLAAALRPAESLRVVLCV